MLVQLGAAVRGAAKPAHSNRALRAGNGNDECLWNTILLSSPKPIGILGIERGSVVPEEGFYDPHTMPEHRAIVKVALIHMLCKHPWGACPQSPLFEWQTLVGKTEYAEGVYADLSQIPPHVVENVIDCGLTQQLVDDLREMSF
jgi:hypothetical protein